MKTATPPKGVTARWVSRRITRSPESRAVISRGTSLSEMFASTPLYRKHLRAKYSSASEFRFNGTIQFVNTGAPSDMVIRGNFVDFVGGAVTETFNFSQDSYTLPLGPGAEAWEVMQGSMNLGNTSAGTNASLSETSDLNGCATGRPRTGAINGTFNLTRPLTA
jgi:hypothetical protein